MTNYKPAYKVVRARGGLKSATMWCSHPVDYIPGRWTERPEGCGPLATFGTREDAAKFRREETRYWETWLCVIKPSRAKRLWKVTKYIRRKYMRGRIPEGTVFADKVMLVERVSEKVPLRRGRRA